RDFHVTGVQTCALPILFIENVQCNGAKVGVFVRGLPEMPVQHIHLKNLNLTVNKGIEIKDTQYLTIENEAFYTASDAPLLYVERSEERRVGKESRWR